MPLELPRQITAAWWLLLGSAVMIVVSVIDQIHGLGTIASQEKIQQALEWAPIADSGLTISRIEQLIRVSGMVAAACATASVILAWQVRWQRAISARLVLSILALPVFVAGMVAGPILPAAFVVGVVLLWTRPAREWLAGTWVAPELHGLEGGSWGHPPYGDRQSSPPAAEASAPTEAPQQPSGVIEAPVSMVGYGQPGATFATPASVTVTPTRPPAVWVAVFLTWVFSLLAIGLFALGAVVLISDPEPVIAEMRRTNPELMDTAGLTTKLIQTVTVFMAGVVALWSLSACVLGVLVVRRVAWARIVLMVCAGSAALVLFIAILGSVVMVAPFLGAVATVVLLARREVAAWVR